MARNNNIKKKNELVKEKFDILEEAIKEKDFLIENLDDKFLISKLITNHEYSLLYILFKHFLCLSEKDLSNLTEDCIEDNDSKFAIIQLFNRQNKKSLKKTLFCIDENKFVNLSNDEIKPIRKGLDKIREEIFDNNLDISLPSMQVISTGTTGNSNKQSNYFYFLYKSLRSILDVTEIKNEIQIEKEFINQQNITVNLLDKQIFDIKAKLKCFESARNEITNKYNNQNINFPNSNSMIANNNNVIVNMGSGHIRNNTTNNNVSYYKRSSSSSIKVKQVNNASNNYSINSNNSGGCSNNSCNGQINKLKELISKIENNYTSLLKNLSKKIIKPKNLIKRPDASFYQSKIK